MIYTPVGVIGVELHIEHLVQVLEQSVIPTMMINQSSITTDL
jgi:hypothetical protein